MTPLRSLVAGLVLAGALGCAGAPPAQPPAPQPQPPAALRAPAGPADLDRQLQELAAIPGANVARAGRALVVRFPDASLFDADSTELSADGVERVRALARAVADHPDERLIVRGHSDAQRDERSNQTFSEERADSVRNLLVAEGVVPSRITAVGLGASQPVATNSTAEGRQQNRRLEVELWPDAAALDGEGAR